MNEGNPSFSKTEPDKKKEKMQKIQRLLEIFKNSSDFQTFFHKT
jgi:hypothetical protein